MQVEFIAFAGDCWVSGGVDLPGAGRLSDLLNAHESVRLRDVQLVGHADGRLVTLDELTLRREELYAVIALDGRGSGARRIHTVRHHLEFQVGPYGIHGYLHSRPGALPLFSLQRRLPLVPLTGASITFMHAGSPEVREVETLIVNRELADWVRADADGRRSFLPEPVATGST